MLRRQLHQRVELEQRDLVVERAVVGEARVVEVGSDVEAGEAVVVAPLWWSDGALGEPQGEGQWIVGPSVTHYSNACAPLQSLNTCYSNA